MLWFWNCTLVYSEVSELAATFQSATYLLQIDAGGSLKYLDSKSAFEESRWHIIEDGPGRWNDHL